MTDSSDKHTPDTNTGCSTNGGEHAASKTKSCCGSSATQSQSSTAQESATHSGCCGSSKPKPKTTASCCGSSTTETQKKVTTSCCDDDDKPSFDWILWGSTSLVTVLILMSFWTDRPEMSWLDTMMSTSIEMLHAMWWGILLGIVLVGWLNRIPREVVVSALGPGHTKRGIFRATLAGLMLDLCNHGILMVAMKLYERGASLGQVMAFLIASPWNSFTLTLILFGLIGIPWTLAFIAFSMVIAWISGMIFDKLELSGTLPMNPYKEDLPADFKLWPELKRLSGEADYSASATFRMLWDGLKGARMVIRWIMFGIVLVALIRAFVPMDIFQNWFGATVGGLFLTLLAATVIEVCSEGSTPIAADLVNRASAPGNGFTFLMAGAATDYTEIMVVKDTMKSWKIALFLPLITVPQVLLIGWLMNVFGG